MDMESTATLRALGLTEYGARAYAALVALGAAGAAQVGEAAQVPRTKIYAVLGELAKKGWVEVNATRPRTYRPVDPAVRIEQGRKQLLDALALEETRLSALYRQEGVLFAGPMWALAGPEAIQRRLQRIVVDAKREIVVSLAWPLPGDEKLFDLLVEAGRRGVHVRVLLPTGGGQAHRLQGGLPLEVREGIVPIRTHFADDRNALVCFRRERSTGSLEFRGIWNPHPEMVAQLREAADQLWLAAGR